MDCLIVDRSTGAVLAEYELLTARHPAAPVFLFETPGGMSARLASDALPLGADTAIGDLPAGELELASSRRVGPRRLSGRAYGSSAIAALASVRFAHWEAFRQRNHTEPEI